MEPAEDMQERFERLLDAMQPSVYAQELARLDGTPPKGPPNVGLAMDDNFRDLVTAIEKLAHPKQIALVRELRNRLGL